MLRNALSAATRPVLQSRTATTLSAGFPRLTQRVSAVSSIYMFRMLITAHRSFLGTNEIRWCVHCAGTLILISLYVMSC
ncbi:hypothetical protein SCLCIDRAFT_146901 [Scleroderma citrinum Foug A]|uniref:Uncharacterized protein n=1 Tax=Scleroderma citrinum Foug A TaxID=1036808 RepID=A0A0C3ERG2_9AGAM|nr:hypothetical protein SCLCIDRAFT_146901 [Scleroderma citrinum Foug A]